MSSLFCILFGCSLGAVLRASCIPFMTGSQQRTAGLALVSSCTVISSGGFVRHSTPCNQMTATRRFNLGCLSRVIYNNRTTGFSRKSGRKGTHPLFINPKHAASEESLLELWSAAACSYGPRLISYHTCWIIKQSSKPMKLFGHSGNRQENAC